MRLLSIGKLSCLGYFLNAILYSHTENKIFIILYIYMYIYKGTLIFLL
jgi:hypothetical protein